MATAECFDGVVEQINKWYDEGHQICFFTSRLEEHRSVTGRVVSKARFQVALVFIWQTSGRKLSLD